MFSFIGGSLASGSQRFIAFEIGRRDKENLKRVFDTTVTIFLFLAVITGILLEIVGSWFLNTQMNIPAERMYAANWVLQLSIITFILNLISIPYNAAVIAHEKMSLYAYISIWECVMKLVSAIALQYILSDKLIIYAVFICGITISVRIIYQVYCKRNFPECRHYHFLIKSYQWKSLLSYSGWNMIGSVALISRQQGVNIVVNLFFGPLLNAAHSLAQQINGVITQFVNNIYIASRPQIIKLYAAEQVDEMWELVFRSSKLAFYLLLLPSIPALIEMDIILKWWLHEIPDYTVTISRLMMLSVLIETLVNQVIGVFQAANKIKRYQLYSSSIIILNVPLSYALLKAFPTQPLIPYIVSITLSLFYVLSILWQAYIEIGLNLATYLKQVLVKCILVAIIGVGVVLVCVFHVELSLLRVFITILLSIISFSFLIWAIGLDNGEKEFFKDILKRKLLRI